MPEEYQKGGSYRLDRCAYQVGQTRSDEVHYTERVPFEYSIVFQATSKHFKFQTNELLEVIMPTDTPNYAVLPHPDTWVERAIPLPDDEVEDYIVPTFSFSPSHVEGVCAAAGGGSSTSGALNTNETCPF